MITEPRIARLTAALPFALSLLLVPVVWLAAINGGWWLLAPVAATWYLFSALDAALGTNSENADPSIGDEPLRWYRLITLIWVPVQFVSLFALIAANERAQLFDEVPTAPYRRCPTVWPLQPHPA